jgi:hypothetical protein
VHGRVTNFKPGWSMSVLGALLGVCIALGAAAAPDLPSLETPDLARGPFSSMRMVLEKTFLNLDVVRVEVRVGPRVQSDFSKAASGRPYSDALEGQLAQVALGADRVVMQVTFLRDVGWSRWLDAARESLEKASRSGLVSADQRRRVSDSLPLWFKAFEEDGYHKGDRLVYEVRPGTLRTVAVTVAGKVMVDRTDPGDVNVRVLLASYFAPGSDFRTPLLKSLFAPASGQQ